MKRRGGCGHRTPTPRASPVGDVRLVYPWLGCGKCATCLTGDENMCIVKANSIGIFCDGGYADYITVPHPRYLLDLKGLDPVTAAPYACSGCHDLQRDQESRSVFRPAHRHFRRGSGPWPDGADASESHGGQGRHSWSTSMRASARRRREGRCTRPRLTACAGRLAADHGEGRRSDPRRHRPRGKFGDRATRLRLSRQGRQAGDGRPVRRRRAMGIAAHSDEGDHDPGQLCRQPARDAGIDRSGCARRTSRRFRSPGCR